MVIFRVKNLNKGRVLIISNFIKLRIYKEQLSFAIKIYY